jgi:hypothetical protein
MGVDFDSCSKCNQSRHDEFVGVCGGCMTTVGCGQSLCTSCLVNDDINSKNAYKYGTICDGTYEQAKLHQLEDGDYGEGDMIDDSGIDPKYCPYCSGKEVHDDEILEFLLKRHKDLTKEDIKGMILVERKKEKK